MHERPPERLLAACEPAAPDAEPHADQRPRDREHAIVADLLELGHRRLYLGEQPVGLRRVAKEEEGRPLDRRSELDAPVTRRTRLLECLGQHLLGSGQLARVPERGPQLRQELESRLLLRREERRSTEQVDRSRNVSARQGSPSRGGEPERSARAELSIALRGWAKLGPIPVRLLQMVADELLVLAGSLLEPVRVALVQLAADLLWEGIVGGVSDQRMAEAEPFLLGEHRPVRADKLLPDKPSQASGDAGPLAGRGERLDRPEVEDVALDRRPLEHPPLGVVQLVEAGRKQHLDRARHAEARQVADGQPAPVLLLEQPLVDEHRQRLLNEQWIARSRLLDPGAHAGVEGSLPEQVVDEPRRLVLGQGLEEDRRSVALAAAPTGPLIEQLRSRHAHEQQRRVAGPLGDVLDQVEQGRLGPVDVVEHDDDGPAPGERLEQLAHSPEAVLGRPGRVREPDQLCNALCDAISRLLSFERSGDLRARLGGRVVLGQSGGLLDDLQHGPERDAFPVGQAGPAQHRRPFSELVERLGHEP